MDQNLPEVPKFDSLEQFITWWESPDVLRVRTAGPASEVALKSHPNVVSWMNYIEKTFIATPDQNLVAPRAPLKIAKGASFGKYQILEKLGEGGMGMVFKAVDNSLSRTVALKLISSSPGKDMDETVQRFLREARTAAKLIHPNILQIFEVAEMEGAYYIAMEFVESGTLDDHWNELQTCYEDTEKGQRYSTVRPGRTNLQIYAEFIRQVAEAVEAAHAEGIVHRDLKPTNILMQTDGEGRVIPKVCDFGLAKETSSDMGLTVSGAVMGTPAFMSPEQAEAVEAEPRSDVFSLGTMLYWACTGASPFEKGSVIDTIQAVTGFDPPPPSRSNPAVDRDLDIIVMKAIEKEPDRRYSSAGEFADDIARYLAGEPIQARPASMVYKAGKRMRKNKVASIGAGLALVALAAAAWFGTDAWQKRSEKLSSAAEYRVQADKAFAEGDYAASKELYGNYLALIEDDTEVGALFVQSDKMLADAKRVEKEAFDEAQYAWLIANQGFIGLFKADSRMEDLNMKFSEAGMLLDSSLKKKPSVLGYFYRGMLHRQTGDPRNAIKMFTAAVEMDPDFTLGYVMRGTVYYEQLLPTVGGIAEHAVLSLLGAKSSDEIKAVANADFDLIRKIDKARDKYPELTEQFNKYIRIFEAMQEWKDNPDLCLAMLEKGYEDTRAEEFLYLLGVWHYNKDYQKAGDLFYKAVQNKPMYAEPYFYLGNILKSLGKTEDALAYYNKGLEINPNLYSIYNNRAEILWMKGDLPGARKDYERSTALNPFYPEPIINLGAVLISEGKFELAIKECDRALAIAPIHYFAFKVRSEAKLGAGDVDGAKKDIDIAFENGGGGDSKTYVTRANVRKVLGDQKGMAEDILQAYKMKGLEPRNLEIAIEVFMELREWARAKECYSELLKNNPQNAKAMLGLGSIEVEMGNLAGGMDLMAKAIELYPDVSYYDFRAQVLMNKLRNFEDALKDLDKALELDPSYSWAHYDRGAALVYLHRIEEAKVEFNKVIELDSSGVEEAKQYLLDIEAEEIRRKK